MEDLKIERYAQSRASFEDRAISGLQDGYSVEQLHEMVRKQLQAATRASWTEEKSLRTRVDLLLMHSMMLRSETSRDAELADLSTLELTNEAEPTFALILTQNKSKTIDQADSASASKTRYNGILRAKATHACPVGALAQWFVYRWDIHQEPPPDFSRRSSWYMTKVVPGSLKKPRDSMSREIQSKWVDRTFDAIDLVSTKCLHTMRKSCARLMDGLELPYDQASYT